MPQYQIEYIVRHVDAVTVLLPHIELVEEQDMTLPPVQRQTKATTGNDSRHKARTESGHQPRKRSKPDTPHERAVDTIVRQATTGTYMMVKYKSMLQPDEFVDWYCTHSVDDSFATWVVGSNNSTTHFLDGTRVTSNHFRPCIVTTSVDRFNKSLTAKRRKKEDGRKKNNKNKKERGRKAAPIQQNDDDQVEYLQVRCLLANDYRRFIVLNILDAVTDGVDEAVAKGQESLNGRWKAPSLVVV